MYKKKVLILCGHYIPGYKAGGPIRTIANTVELLGDEFNFIILTGDRDLGDKAAYPFLKKKTEWYEVGKAKVRYLNESELGFSSLPTIINQIDFDVLYLNGLFSLNFSIKPLLLRRFGFLKKTPVVLAPRGELSKGAIQLKHRKKIVFKLMAKMVDLYQDVRWQATSLEEKKDIQRELSWIEEEQISIAMDLPDISTLNTHSNFSPRETGQPLRLVFISRIHPKKNLDYVIRFLAKTDMEINFDIYGILDSQDYFEQCLQLIETLPPNIRCRYLGDLQPKDVVSTVSMYDAFLFPTRGENYGHVILESLTGGTPVIISDQTPWKDLEKWGVGWTLPLDFEDEFLKKIKSIAALSTMEQVEQRERCINYAKSYLENSTHIEENQKLFNADFT